MTVIDIAALRDGRALAAARSPAAVAAAHRSGTGASTLVESRGSWPAMVWSRMAASSTPRARGPIWSRDEP